MVIVILGLIAGVGTPVLMVAYQSFFLGSIIQESDTRARLATERMLRELRGARIASLLPGSGNSVTFLDQTGSSVTFRWNTGGLLMRNNAILAEGITALNFDVATGMPPVQLVNNALPMVTVDLTVTVNGQGLSVRGGVSPLNP